MFVFTVSWKKVLVALSGVYVVVMVAMGMGGMDVLEEGFFSVLLVVCVIVLIGAGIAALSRKKSSATVEAPEPELRPLRFDRTAPTSSPSASSKAPSQSGQNTGPSQPQASAASAKKFCGHCGSKVNEGDVYCVECGERL